MALLPLRGCRSGGGRGEDALPVAGGGEDRPGDAEPARFIRRPDPGRLLADGGAPGVYDLYRSWNLIEDHNVCVQEPDPGGYTLPPGQSGGLRPRLRRVPLPLPLLLDLGPH